jgi:hypothetical protein
VFSNTGAGSGRSGGDRAPAASAENAYYKVLQKLLQCKIA